jgi:hypothetical protein
MRFEQGFAVPLLAIEGVTGLTPGADQQERETNFVHGRSLCCRQFSTEYRHQGE